MSETRTRETFQPSNALGFGLAVIVGCGRSPSVMPSAAPDDGRRVDRFAV